MVVIHLITTSCSSVSLNVYKNTKQTIHSIQFTESLSFAYLISLDNKFVSSCVWSVISIKTVYVSAADNIVGKL